MKNIIVYVGMFVVTGAACAAEQDSRDCGPFGDATRVIAACSSLIDASFGESHNPASANQELTSNIAAAYANRGFAYFRNGKVDQAIPDYDEALRLNPKLAMVYNYRGLWYLVKHDNDRAIAEFSKGIKLDPKDAQLLMGRGAAHSIKGEVRLALADYDAAIESDPKFYVSLMERGIVQYYDNAPDKARNDFARAAAIAPKDPMAAIWLDIVDRHAGKKS
jgi:lipoprotein NlpI